MVPAAWSPKRRVAAVLLVAAKPTIAEQRATAMAASRPWQRRMAKSISWAPAAASRQRAALEATAVWKLTRFSRVVSTSWASAMGAVTSSSGSPASTSRPSGTAHTSPVNRSRPNAARADWSKPAASPSQASSSPSKPKPSRKLRQSSRPAATRNPRSEGSSRTTG